MTLYQVTKQNGDSVIVADKDSAERYAADVGGTLREYTTLSAAEINREQQDAPIDSAENPHDVAE